MRRLLAGLLVLSACGSPIVSSPASGAAVATTAGIAPAGLATVGTTRIALEGEVGDKIVNGKHVDLGEPIVTTSRLETGTDEFFHSEGTNFYDVLFRNRDDGTALTPGLYEGATKATDQGKSTGNHGMHFFGSGVGCFVVKGRFRVDEVQRDGTGALTAFAARFEQHCEGVDAAAFGSIAYHATVPIYAHQLSALSLAFPPVATGTTTAPQDLTITNTSSVALPVTSIAVTGSGAASFQITSDPCSGTSIPVGGTCTVKVTYTANAAGTVIAKLTIADAFTSWGTAPTGEDVALSNTGSTTPAPTPTPTPTPAPTPAPAPGTPGSGGTGGANGGGLVSHFTGGGEFHPLSPTRILDTRDGTGQAGAIRPLGDAETRTFAAAGAGGVPTTGAVAVAVNLTAVNARQPGWLSLFPGGTTWPGSSSVNFPTNGIAPNMAVTALGTDGTLALRNCCGSVDAIVDVVGWYGAPDGAPALGYQPLAPARLLDTRDATQPLTAGESRHIAVAGHAGVPASASAVVVNMTATGPTAATYLTAYPSDVALPSASSLNVGAGETRANLVTVLLGSDGAIDVYDHAGRVDVVLDVVGYYGPSRGASGRLATGAPIRVLDTRTVTDGGLTAGQVGTIDFRGDDGQVHVDAVILNVTVTEATEASYVTVYPDGPLPTASSLNMVRGQTIANLVVVPVPANGLVDIYNHAGFVHVVADLVGVISK